MKKRSVSIYAGGGGSRSTGKSRALDTNVILNSERTEAQSENVKQNRHAELVSASIQRCELPVSLDRSRNKFGMTLKDMPSLRVDFTMAARLSRCHNGLVGLRSAFTMAEILLSLTIIGVVAAITLPSLTGNINERTWNTQRKALYARFSQAIALMPSLNGYGTLREETDSAGSTSIEDTAAETFVTSGLSKVLKINNICDHEHFPDCGIPDKVVTLKGDTLSNFTTSYNTLVKFNNMFNGSYSFTDGGGCISTYSQMDTKAAAFETANGESLVTYYNPYCTVDMGEYDYYLQPKVCANFVYDLNGSKGPNTVGKDIGFLTVFYPSDSLVVAPNPVVGAFGSGLPYDESVQKCRSYDDSRLPNINEMGSMFVNRSLLYGNERTGSYWSTSRGVTNGSTGIYYLNFNTGVIRLNKSPATTTSNLYWCVKRN